MSKVAALFIYNVDKGKANVTALVYDTYYYSEFNIHYKCGV